MDFVDPFDLDDFMLYQVKKVVTETYYRESENMCQPGEPKRILEVQKLVYAVAYRTECWKKVEEFNIIINEAFVEQMKRKQTKNTTLHIGMFNDSEYRFLMPQNVCKKTNKEVEYIEKKQLLR